MNEITNENLTEWLDSLSKNQQINFWNKFSDNHIYEMDDLDDLCEGMSVIDIIDRFGQMDTSCYYWLDDNTSYVSASDCGDYPIELMDIDYLVIVLHEQGLTTDKLADILMDL